MPLPLLTSRSNGTLDRRCSTARWWKGYYVGYTLQSQVLFFAIEKWESVQIDGIFRSKLCFEAEIAAAGAACRAEWRKVARLCGWEPPSGSSHLTALQLYRSVQTVESCAVKVLTVLSRSAISMSEVWSRMSLYSFLKAVVMPHFADFASSVWEHACLIVRAQYCEGNFQLGTP